MTVPFYGEKIISYFETLGTIALYVGYLCFSIFVIANHTDNIGRVLETTDFSYTPDATIGFAFWTGIIYMAYNLVVFPASFFTVHRLKTRFQTVVSGIIAGLLMVIPWFLTYFAILSFYPSKEVVEAPVPWVLMMQMNNAPSWMLLLFSFVMGWTLIETATGIIHAMLSRVNKGLEEKNRQPLSRRNRAILTVAILVISVLLSKIGIIALIAKAYSALAYAFIIMFLIPLCTVGVYKILKKERETHGDAVAAADSHVTVK